MISLSDQNQALMTGYAMVPAPTAGSWGMVKCTHDTFVGSAAFAGISTSFDIEDEIAVGAIHTKGERAKQFARHRQHKMTNCLKCPIGRKCRVCRSTHRSRASDVRHSGKRSRKCSINMD